MRENSLKNVAMNNNQQYTKMLHCLYILCQIPFKNQALGPRSEKTSDIL